MVRGDDHLRAVGAFGEAISRAPVHPHARSLVLLRVEECPRDPRSDTIICAHPHQLAGLHPNDDGTRIRAERDLH